MKVIIAGGRYFDNYSLLVEKCDHYLKNQKDVEIVHGGAKGADTLAGTYCLARMLKVKVFHADWKKHGNYAGPIRNKQMADYADCLIAFWDGKSKGTKNMITLAQVNGLKVRIVNY